MTAEAPQTETIERGERAAALPTSRELYNDQTHRQST